MTRFVIYTLAAAAGCSVGVSTGSYVLNVITILTIVYVWRRLVQP